MLEKIENLSYQQKESLLDKFSPFITDARKKKILEVINLRTSALTVVLEDLYQPHNIGACLRSCELLGLTKVHIVENRNPYKDNAAVSLGSAKWLEIIKHKIAKPADYQLMFKKLIHDNYTIVTTNLNQPSVEIGKLDLRKKIAVCFGSEELGLSPHIKGDYNIKLPSFGFTQSYNVSVAVALTIFAWREAIKQQNITLNISKHEKIDLMLDWYMKIAPASEQLLNQFLTSI
ncbi:MAG: RNA methyltransferase [SAR324 cluster bacterium]|nr:RNA methyltransferase [SAR324 cluster bacterium]